MHLFLIFLPLIGVIPAIFSIPLSSEYFRTRWISKPTFIYNSAVCGVACAFRLSLYTFYDIIFCNSSCLIRIAP